MTNSRSTETPLRSGPDLERTAEVDLSPTDLYLSEHARKTDDEVAHARRLAERYRLEYVDMGQFRIDQELFRSIPADVMLRYGFVPHRREGESLVIVVSDPTDVPKLDELTLLLGSPVRVTVGTPSSIESILKKSEGSQRVLDEATESFEIQLLHEDESSDDSLTVEAADERSEPGHPVGRLDDLHGDPAPRQRHPRGDAGRRRLRQVSRRRGLAVGDAADRQAVSQSDLVPGSR